MSAPTLATRALDLLGSEWTKFRSVRSTYWSLLVAVVTPIAVSAVVAFAFTNAPGHGPPPDPLLPGVISLEYAVIAVSVLGVLAFSAEYSTGLIQVTFTAAPRRRAVLAAKAVVLAAADAGRRRGGRLRLVRAGPGDPGEPRPGRVAGAPRGSGGGAMRGLLLCVCALLGLALGAIIRHTAGGIAATIAVILVPGIAALLPSPWNGRIGRFTLLEAAQQVSALHPAADLFSPGWSLLVLLAWPAAGLAAAALLITRRDA